MPYEPVGYILEYEISAMLFLGVIMLRYFGARRFPNQKNKLFSLILWVTAADMLLDIVSSLIIDNVFLVPQAVTHSVNLCFYLLQLILPLLMTAYTLAMVGRLNAAEIRRLFPLLIPGLGIVLLLLSNPVTHWFFYVDPSRGYVHGKMFIFTYLVCFFYMGVTFFTALRSRSQLTRDEFSTICRFLVIVLVSVFIQFVYPPLLITGVAIALSVILMYFTIQNPETMLDRTTGAFTYEAMITFLNDSLREKRPVRIVAIDIHNMRRINELMGIESGSLLLRKICLFLQACGEDIWVFRMRGACFVAVLRGRDENRSLSKRLEERFNRPWSVGSGEILLQATLCGISAEELFFEPITPEKAINYIDTAFLQTSRTGSKIKTITVGQDFLERLQRSRLVEAALRGALDSGEGLELYFQPLWSVSQRRFASAEVLLRLNHPVLGTISPAEFVPIAESNGLVTDMDELVLRKACAFIRDFEPRRTLGLEYLELNLSALEFMRSRLPQLLDSIMREYGVEPCHLLFEITETAATESFALLKECMSELCGRGCRFALDDFGTGYANISQVIRLPFSMVKLDRSMLLGPESVLEDMTRMFARINKLTVIEGVETQAQAELAERIQADFIQGYRYARPMSRDNLIRFLSDNAKGPGAASR